MQTLILTYLCDLNIVYIYTNYTRYNFCFILQYTSVDVYANYLISCILKMAIGVIIDSHRNFLEKVNDSDLDSSNMYGCMGWARMGTRKEEQVKKCSFRV